MVVLASTTSTQDSGLLDPLTERFEKENPDFRVKVVAVGSGEAMELGRRGDADVLLVHSPDDEEKFMKEGRGASRRPVMRNDFVIAGPPRDPAGVARRSDAVEVFRLISSARWPFISRGDDSGTHKRERKTWDRAEVRPAGRWYIESGQGMAETLTLASELEAYVLTDTATLKVMAKGLRLSTLSAGDPLLVNPYSVIPVRGSTRRGALAFADWITGPRGQDFIESFGASKFGDPLFTPTAAE